MTTPRLSPTVVTTDDLLTAAITTVIEADDEDRQHRETIAGLQAELRGHVDDQAWDLYSRIEAAISARLGDLAVTLVTWAFVEGQRDSGRFEGDGR